MIFSTEIRSTIAQALAAREAESSAMNRDRLESWAQRYPFDLVNVPVPIHPPEWPATRASILPLNNVTPLTAKKRK